MNSPKVNDLEIINRKLESNVRFSDLHWIVIWQFSVCNLSGEVSRFIMSWDSGWRLTAMSCWGGWWWVECHAIQLSLSNHSSSCAVNGHARLWCGKRNDWLIRNAFYSYCGCGFVQIQVQSKCVLHKELSHYWQSCLLAISQCLGFILLL